MITYKWILPQLNLEKLKEYRKYNIPDLMAQILINRNFNAQDYLDIKDGSWFNFISYYADNIVGLNAAAKKVLRGIINPKTKVFVFSDYDTDGITSTAIAKLFWEDIRICMRSKTLNEYAPIEYYIPNRNEGYGLNMKWCENLIKQKKNDPGYDYLVVTFDNGINKIAEINRLLNSDIDVVITDHHETDRETPSCIFVDPKATKERFGEELCGAGISFLLAFQMLRLIHEYSIKTNPSIDANYLKNAFCAANAYAAIGTVGDIMPMTKFNLALVCSGLNCINSNDENLAPYLLPIKELMDLLKIKYLTGKEIAFGISPIFNACGQLEQINKIKALLLDYDDDNVQDLAQEVFRVYTKNKSMTRAAKQKIRQVYEDNAEIFDNNLFNIYCIKQGEVPQGIVGKIANYISEITSKPAIVTVDNGDYELKGSGRCSNNTISMLDLLQKEIPEGLIKMANGHQGACGVVLYADKIKDLQAKLNGEIKNLLDDGHATVKPEKDLIIDSYLDADSINNQYLLSIIHTLPYANNFPDPVFCLAGEIIGYKRSDNNPNNVKYTIRSKKTGAVVDIWVWDKKAYEYDESKHSQVIFVGNIERDFLHPSEYTLSVIDLKFQ